MLPGPDPAEDHRDLDELFAAALAEQWLDQDDYEAATWASRTLYWRSTREIFDRLVALAQSADTDERCLGIDLMGEVLDTSQRGDARWGEWNTLRSPGFVDESIAILTAIANPSEPDEDVRYAVVTALGRRWDPRALEPLLGFVRDPDDDVRESVARSLSSSQERLDPSDPPEPLEELRMRAHNDRIARALRGLAEDHIGSVRDWALSGLAGLDIDSPAIRESFADHLDDSHEDARMEAICGLAALGDARAIEPLIGLLEDGADLAALDAAAASGDPQLLPVLRALESADPDHPGLDRAIEACRRRAASDHS